MKVKIIKVTESEIEGIGIIAPWYKDDVGEIYEVSEEITVLDGCENYSIIQHGVVSALCIKCCDCEIIENNINTMKKIKALTTTWDDFDDVINHISNGEAGIANDINNWFYVSTKNYDIDNINKDLSDYLHVKVKSVLIDLSKEGENVVIIYG